MGRFVTASAFAEIQHVRCACSSLEGRSAQRGETPRRGGATERRGTMPMRSSDLFLVDFGGLHQ